MKHISVYLKEPIEYKSLEQRFNKEKHCWEEVEVIKKEDTFSFSTLTAAKKFIRQQGDNYKNSCITKIWANGDWENLGPVQMEGENKHFVTNTRMKKAGY